MKIYVYNDWDGIPKASAGGERQVVLAWDGEYRRGDRIDFADLTPGKFYVVKVDAALEEAYIYCMLDKITYVVPFYEKKTSYNPLAFWGNRHYISIREAREDEVRAYRNLALNPFDQHDVEGIYPHASANVETRGEAVFAARNAIDGCIATRGHGEWPYASWGINRQADAEIRIDFGRPVDIEEIRLYTRADFPHDSWWTQGTLHFSDGSREIIQMDKQVDAPHVFSGIVRKGISWLTLGDLVKAEDESPFPALTQIEVYGKEADHV